MSGPGTLARKLAEIAAGIAELERQVIASERLGRAVASTGNIRRGGSRKAIVSRWRLSASRLPVRRKNGTPAQRQLSTCTRARRRTSPCRSRVARPPRRGSRRTGRARRPPGRSGGIASNTFVFSSTSGLGSSDVGRLHRDEAEHLEQVRHDHVAERAGALVEAGARADRERLGHVDLDVVDVVAVPDRLEHAVREPQREDVLHRLLAEVVVDPEDLRLVEARRAASR